MLRYAAGLTGRVMACLQTLSEVRVPVLSVVCEPCGRRERYDVERLMRQYGWDAKLTDLLPALVRDCPWLGLASLAGSLPIGRRAARAFLVLFCMTREGAPCPKPGKLRRS
jgi:hypothetical protein